MIKEGEGKSQRTEYYNEIATEWRCEEFKLFLIMPLSGIP